MSYTIGGKPGGKGSEYILLVKVSKSCILQKKQILKEVVQYKICSPLGLHNILQTCCYCNVNMCNIHIAKDDMTKNNSICYLGLHGIKKVGGTVA